MVWTRISLFSGIVWFLRFSPRIASARRRCGFGRQSARFAYEARGRSHNDIYHIHDGGVSDPTWLWRRPRPRCLIRHSGGQSMAGLYFEDFHEGQVFEHALSRTVTEMDNVLFSTLTLNPQPLHLFFDDAKTT